MTSSHVNGFYSVDESTPEAISTERRAASTMGGDRIPPHDLDAEAAVLSAILLERGALSKARSILEPEHFYSEANRRVYEAAIALELKGAPTIDFVTVCAELRDRRRLAQIGGSPYLAQLVDCVPSIAHIEAYARVVKEKWRVRQFVATCQRFASEGYGDFGDEQTFLDSAARTLADLASDNAQPKVAVQSPPATPAEIVARWREEGPLVRIPTGIRLLDQMSHGGWPVPWRVLVVGAPAAGKTFLEVLVADHLAGEREDVGMCVGILAVDEEPDDVTVRLAQIGGLSLEDAERRDPEVLAAVTERLSNLRLRLYDASHSIESAAADLAQWAASLKRRGALFLDSLQAVRSQVGRGATTPRELVEANMTAMRTASTRHQLLVVATVEANRGAYRSEDAAATTNDMAAGAESRSIEYAAQTLLMLRTPKDHPGIIHVRVAKNRRAHTGEFWLRLDRERHLLSECGNPSEDPILFERKVAEKRAGTRTGVYLDADVIADLVRQHPGIAERELRAAVKAAGHGWGVGRFDAAKHVLTLGHKGGKLVNRGPHPRAVRWFLDSTEGQ